MSRKRRSKRDLRREYGVCDVTGKPKVAYPTEGLATNLAAQMIANGKAVNVYHCEHCTRWHIGGTTAAKRGSKRWLKNP